MAHLNLLFIGNSFTARNDLPALLADLARAAGHDLTWKLVSRGGASLRMHWNKGAAGAEVAGGGYDRVVLQEQSTLPLKNATRMHENVRLFDAAAKAAGTRTVLYMTWARRHAPATQQAIGEAYTRIAAELGADVIPAGTAWQIVRRRADAPELYDADGSHPTLAGSYLAACCAVAVLFGTAPAGLPAPAGLSMADATILQDAAAEATAARAGR